MSPNPGIWACGRPCPEVAYFSSTSHSSSTSNSNSTSNGNTNSSSTCICIWLYVYAFVFVFAFICVFLYVYVYVYVQKTIYVYDYVDIIVLLNMIVCRDLQKNSEIHRRGEDITHNHRSPRTETHPLHPRAPKEDRYNSKKKPSETYVFY